MTTQVKIPGSFTAIVEYGRITRYVFVPHASHAGYFGPAFEIIENDDDNFELSEREFFDMVSSSLMSTDQTAFFSCEWSE